MGSLHTTVAMEQGWTTTENTPAGAGLGADTAPLVHTSTTLQEAPRTAFSMALRDMPHDFCSAVLLGHLSRGALLGGNVQCFQLLRDHTRLEEV